MDPSTIELLPGSPQQEYVVGLIEKYLSDKVDDPSEAALHTWRLTKTELRPVLPTP